MTPGDTGNLTLKDGSICYVKVIMQLKSGDWVYQVLDNGTHTAVLEVSQEDKFTKDP